MTHPILLFFCYLLTISMAFTRTTGQVNYKYLGIQFTIPDGWVGQEVEGGYLIGLLNPCGNGVTIMVATTPELYSETHKQLALQIANSVIFSKAETLPVAAEQWEQKFSNARLTYMDSYYSSGTSYDGYSTGGGYSAQTQINLCAQGYFRYKSSSSC